MRISDWSSDVCSSDLAEGILERAREVRCGDVAHACQSLYRPGFVRGGVHAVLCAQQATQQFGVVACRRDLAQDGLIRIRNAGTRSEEHTSELQSLMRNSYAVFCLNTKTPTTTRHPVRPSANTA